MNGNTVDAGQSSVKLNDTDIPGAHLDEPFEAHNVAVLRWWLLCRGIKLTSFLQKHQIIARWKHKITINIHAILQLYPGVGRSKAAEWALRALSRGFTHWASGRLEHLEININNPSYCHVRSNMKPSVKQGSYDVYLLLERTKEDMGSIRAATWQCTAGYVCYMYLSYTFKTLLFISLITRRKSAPCTHISWTGWVLSPQYRVDGSISKDTPNPLQRTAARNFFIWVSTLFRYFSGLGS